MESKKKVVYEVFNPSGEKIAFFGDRKNAKEFINRKNANTPSWHYDELYKMMATVIDR